MYKGYTFSDELLVTEWFRLESSKEIENKSSLSKS